MSRRRGGRSRGAAISFKVPAKIKRALAKARTEVKTAVIVGKVRAGNLELEPTQLAKVTRRRKGAQAAAQILFVALNAPFKTKALTGSL
jgi:hypothetical protein